MRIVCIFFTLAILLISAQVQCDPPANQKAQINQPQSPNPKDLLRDQVNPTDSLAIPLDSSEVDIDEELKTLEKEEKEFYETQKAKSGH